MIAEESLQRAYYLAQELANMTEFLPGGNYDGATFSEWYAEETDISAEIRHLTQELNESLEEYVDTQEG